jgi:hypothetical protein
MGKLKGAHKHKEVVGQQREGLALVALDQDTGRIDEAEGLVGETGHDFKAIDSVLRAYLGDIYEIHLSRFR